MCFLKVLLNDSRCSEKCFRAVKRKETSVQEDSMLALSGNAADAFFLMLVPSDCAHPAQQRVKSLLRSL